MNVLSKWKAQCLIPLFGSLLGAQCHSADLCAQIEKQAEAGKLKEYSVSFVALPDDVLRYEIDIDGDSTKDSLSSQCGYSSDAECKFTLMSGGKSREFYDQTGYRFVKIGDSYYLVYGVSYLKDQAEVAADQFRVVAVQKDFNSQLCTRK